jgi:hypothetical protein
VSLFDFGTEWFEMPLPVDDDTASGYKNGNGTTALRDPLVETASIVASAVSDTASTMVKAAVETVKRKAIQGAQGSGTAGFEWTKGLVGKKEWRIPCLDVLVRV